MKESLIFRKNKTDFTECLLLKRIVDFKEQNDLLIGKSNLFNYEDIRKAEIDKQTIELLNELDEKIKKEGKDQKGNDLIQLQDLFDLEFEIKEGKNTIKSKQISNIGSEGTNILVKSIIYITLLHTFIEDAKSKTSQNFFIHCIIDEVGKLHSTHLKDLIDFAAKRKIYLINGLPNESKIESVYTFTYKIWKLSQEISEIRKVLTVEIEA